MMPTTKPSIKLIWVIIVPFLFSVKPAVASPSPAIQHLMSEPATMFDLGMFRLLQQVSHFASTIDKFLELPELLNKKDVGEGSYFLGTVNYDAIKGKLVITYTLMQTTPVPNMAKVEHLFKMLFTTTLKHVYTTEAFGSIFSHYADAPEKKEELAKELIKRVEIVITQFSRLLPTSSTLSQGPIKVEKIVRCQSALVSDQISCSVEKAE